MTEQERKELSALMLEDKLRYSQDIIRTVFEQFGDDVVLAWTGGKDSTLMLWLYRETCTALGKQLPRCIFINEGDVFDEILELVDRVKRLWDIKVIELKNEDILNTVCKIGDIIQVKRLSERNRMELEQIGFHDGEFPFEPESFVGNHLMKTVPLKVFIEENAIQAVSTAIRWDEHEARKEEVYFSGRTNPQHTRIQPILHFRERDVWNAIHKYYIPFCRLYEIGYRSLGARCSTYKNSDIAAWQQDLENTPERVGRGQAKEQIMDQLRSLGYM